MFKDLMNNLSKTQKIVLGLVAQAVVVITLILLVQTFTAEKPHVEIESESATEMPKNVEDFVADNIWTMIRSKVADVAASRVEDAVIREGTYETFENSDGSIGASFIVDIDSLKQSYTVSTGWTKNGEILDTSVDCPPLSEMKYPETVCYGAYHNTYSLDLYLPYSAYSEGSDAEDAESMAPNVYITGDENSKTITVMVSMCDVERFRAEADEYLKTIPIDFSNYTINYEINDIDVEC